MLFRSVVVVGAATVVVVVVGGHSDAIIEPQVPVVVTVPQVQVPALHALTTSFVQRLNTPPLNPDSPASSVQALRLHGDEGAAACPSEGATLSQKRAATTVVVRITVPMTSSVLPRGQAPRESCSSANRRYQGGRRLNEDRNTDDRGGAGKLVRERSATSGGWTAESRRCERAAG